MSEGTMVETLRANLQPEIQSKIVYERADTVSELRRLVSTTEIFMQSVGKTKGFRQRQVPKRQDCEV